MILQVDTNRTPIKGQGKLIKDGLKMKRLTIMQFCRNNKLMDLYVQFSGWLNGVPNGLQSSTFIEALKIEGVIDDFEIVAENKKYEEEKK